MAWGSRPTDCKRVGDLRLPSSAPPIAASAIPGMALPHWPGVAYWLSSWFGFTGSLILNPCERPVVLQ